ncbi:CDP-alcohol phosphatidyltransferase family protein [Candidatus Dependentiae bacterium]
MKNNISSIFADKSWFTLANFLTFSRIILTPVIVYQIFYQNWLNVFSLILFVSLTDLFDGYLARKFNHGTNLGKVLDPIADKFLLVSLFVSLAFLHSPSFFIPYWFVGLIVLRESIILIGSMLLLVSDKSFQVEPTIFGKLTTFFQLIFIVWIFLCYFFCWAPAKTYYVLTSLLAIFSILSLIQYIKIGFDFFQKK